MCCRCYRQHRCQRGRSYLCCCPAITEKGKDVASEIGKGKEAFNDFTITSKICDIAITGRVDFQAYLDMNEDYYTNEVVAAAHEWMDNITEEEFMAALPPDEPDEPFVPFASDKPVGTNQYRSYSFSLN